MSKLAQNLMCVVYYTESVAICAVTRVSICTREVDRP